MTLDQGRKRQLVISYNVTTFGRYCMKRGGIIPPDPAGEKCPQLLFKDEDSRFPYCAMNAEGGLEENGRGVLRHRDCTRALPEDE